MTPQQQDKLESIEYGAEVNTPMTGKQIAERLVHEVTKLPPPLRLDLARALEKIQDELDDSRQGN